MIDLLGRYPNNNLIGRRPILGRRNFGLQSLPASVAYGVLSPVSGVILHPRSGYPRVTEQFAEGFTPLDLHGLVEPR